jgi:AraC-like DNA-binding protein
VGAYRTTTVAPEFWGEARAWRHGGMQLLSVRSSAGHTSWDPRFDSGPQRLQVGVHLSGVSRLLVDGRELTIGPGDVLATLSGSLSHLEYPGPIHHTVLEVPSAHDHEVRLGAAGRRYRLLRAGSGLVDAYAGLLRQLVDAAPRMTPAAARQALTSATGLAAAMLTLGDERGGDCPSGRRSADVTTLKDYIRTHLSDPDLSVAKIARAHHISPRYVQVLFAEQGESAAAWTRQQRVAAARRDLADPGLTHVPVARVGMRLGFRTASHFGQVFREATGQSPNAFRADQARAGAA